MESVVENTKQLRDEDAALPAIEEQVAFRRRYRNSNLERFTIKQLKAKAKKLNLNIQELNYRWEFIDLLEKSQHSQVIVDSSSSYRTYLNRPSFLDFPAEIRNKIYGYALKNEEEIFSCSHYWQVRRLLRCFHGSRRKLRSWNNGDKCFAALNLLKQLNHLIRDESVSYYYSNNKFDVCDPCWSHLPKQYMHFFASIGEEGRTRLRHLTIGETIYPIPSKDHYQEFMCQLRQCQQMQYLDILIHPLGLLKGGPEIWDTARGEVSQVDVDISNFLNDLKPLDKLRRLHLRVLAPSRWYYYFKSPEVSKETQKALGKEELEKRFKAALPTLHFTIEIKGW